MSKARAQARRFHEPLHEFDTPMQTMGCRCTNPDTCSRHSMPAVCAFVRDDATCLSPPASWPKQYKKLLTEREQKNGS